MGVRQNTKISEFSLKYSALLLGKTALKLKVSIWVLWRGFELQWCCHLPNICFSNKLLRTQLTCIDTLCNSPKYLWLQNLYVYGAAAAPINTFSPVLLLACSWLSRLLLSHFLHSWFKKKEKKIGTKYFGLVMWSVTYLWWYSTILKRKKKKAIHSFLSIKAFSKWKVGWTGRPEPGYFCLSSANWGWLFWAIPNPHWPKPLVSFLMMI